jgi:hypothetical protein
LSCSESRVRDFPGFEQLARPRHILADLDGLSFDVRDRLRAFFGRQALTVCSRDCFR